MSTDAAEPKPRRKWHLTKALVLLIVATSAYAQWRAYTFNSALKQAYALNWQVRNTKPVDLIYDDWKNAFKKDTWFDGVASMEVPTGEELEQHRAMIQKLNPKDLTVGDCQSLRDLSALKGHTQLKVLWITSPSSLTNLDALQNLTALERIKLDDAQALTNVDGLKNLLAVNSITLWDATKITNLDALKNVPTLEDLDLRYCTALTNLDGLKNHKRLQTVHLVSCAALTNVEGLKNLPELKKVGIFGSTGLTKESIEALKATLPRTIVYAMESELVPKPPQP